MMSSMQILNSKARAETIPVVFDFISKLAVGDTVASAVCTSTVYSGVDTNPALMISGAATVPSSTKVQQKVTGGTVGTIYKLNCKATTTAGYVLTIDAYLPVVDDTL